MPLLKIDDLYLSLGQFPLLDHLQLQIENKEHICLIGRNGEGKSTLLRIIAGIEQADSGTIKIEQNHEVAMLMQELPPADDKTVFAVVAEGVKDIGKLIQTYHDITSHQPPNLSEEAWLKEIDKLGHEIEIRGGWDVQQRIDKVITELNLPPDTKMQTLSGGWRRRVGLAKTLVRQPDLLLLDEPTNHLDIETIQWLEKLLINYPKAILFITHDRALLRKTATRIIELDRGTLTSYPGDYDTYLKRKAKTLEEEEIHNKEFDKKLAKEEVWIRQGIKARRTRNEGRVRALKALREERQKRREQRKGPTFKINTSESVGKLAIDAQEISFWYEENKPLIRPFSLTIQKGDKLALIGPNGVGKTTLINLLIGNLQPKAGIIKQSPTNQVALFDQNRAQINPQKTLIDNVAEGDDFVEINGKRKHIISYLGDFLFSPDKCHALAGTLSGGECNRLLLAKLFSKPANLLVLDEPTNDLDLESLELLETLLLEYSGTVIIISHDREFIDNIATLSIAFEGDGYLNTIVGGYSDWQKYKNELQTKTVSTKKTTSKITKPTENQVKKPATQKKLSYHEQRELDELPKKIESLENQISTLQLEIASPNFFQQPQDIVKQKTQALEQLETELAAAFERWEMLC